MNGSTTGLEPADSSSASDPVERWNRALIAFRAASTAAEQVGEWKLQREASDAEQRAKAEILRLSSLQQRSVDGENPQDARQKEEVSDGD